MNSSTPQLTLPVPGHEDVYLRLMKLEDADEFFRALSAGGPNLDRYQYWDRGFSLEAVRAEVERSVDEIAQGRMLRYEIVNQANEAIIGETSFYDHDPATNTAYFGYLVVSDFEGKGIVHAATEQLIGYGSERWQLKRILMEIEQGNERSEHLADKLGAKPTDEVKQVNGGGKIRDMRLWEVVRE